MMTDPVADMLTRIRNASRIELQAVEMPATELKVQIAKVLRDEGFILGYRVGAYVTTDEGATEFREVNDPSIPKRVLHIGLKYGPEGERLIRRIDRASRPG